MNWMLLPLDANVGRNVDDHPVIDGGGWAALARAGLGLVRQFLAAIHL
jgi:hypothetical protein